ncbi:hypothetical protein TanjilG_09344 [Lupinus angustifolius]|uniref:Uncharacterized protein n=1 Tax=Lupinus angustifolius TaxID=3871 RepID=A0A4P1RMW7_LUPAN|nr:hypothetical protein TanjilG_09344 [Lupinus angustifolius]
MIVVPIELGESEEVSQTDFKGFRGGTCKIHPAGGGVSACRKDNSVSQTPHTIANGSFDLNDKSNELDSEFHLNDKSNELDLNVTANAISDQSSHPEIVIEQEELNDSEEDIEEHVEFECEEMVDSEGEDGSGFEQAPEVQTKEVPTSSEENVVKHTTSMEKPCEPGQNSDAQADDSIHMNDTNILNIALISKGKDDRSSSYWSSLDSSNITDNSIVQELNLGPGVFAKLRKPRKHSGNWNASLNIG